MVECEMPKISEKDRRCAIFIDEMAIKEGEVWDASAKRFIGKTTFPPHQGLAKKALVIMIAHLATRYKYAVAYYFTSSSAKKRERDADLPNEVGEALRDIVLEVIRRGEGIGLLIDAVISDMGPDNQAMWKAFGIICKAWQNEVICSIPHPMRPSDKLWFMPDPMHLAKNVLSMLSSNKVVLLSDADVVEENLDDNEVNLEHLKDLVTYENAFELKVAFRLKEENLENLGHFKKMKVGTTRSVFNKRTEVALRMQASETGVRNSATTFFVSLVSEWFSTVSNRTLQMALGKRDPDEYNRRLDVLRKIIKVFRRMKIGEKGNRKPIQTGMLNIGKT